MYVWINIKHSNCHFIGGQTCSGIDDETRGIQLSYMNDASNGWIQIAYFPDTLLYTVSNAFTLSLIIQHILSSDSIIQIPKVTICNLLSENPTCLHFP